MSRRRYTVTVIYVAYAIFAYGCCVSLINFYIKFLHCPINCILGRTVDDSKSSSLIPIIGSLLIIVSVYSVAEIPWLFWGGVVSAILDTGGLHWFAVMIFFMPTHGDT